MASRADTSLDDILNSMRANLRKSAAKNKRTAPVASGGLRAPLAAVPVPVQQQKDEPIKKSPPKKRLIEASATKSKKAFIAKKETGSKSSNPFSWKKGGASVFNDIKPDMENIKPCGIEDNITCSRGSRVGSQGRVTDFKEDSSNYSIYTRGSKINYNRSTTKDESKSSSRKQFGRLFWQNRGPAILHIMNIDKSVSKADILGLFSMYGELKQGTLQFDSMGDSAGAAFVVFQNYSDAIKAMKALKGITLDGHQLNIHLLKSKVSK